MITSERRAIADRALNQIDKLELEIRAQMTRHNLKGELDDNYADFKAYSKLRELHGQYAEWKEEYARYADNDDLVSLVGQSEHDILRENYPKMSSQTEIVTLTSSETVAFYERDTGTGQDDKLRYTVTFEKIRILPFHTYYLKELDHLFIRVNQAGKVH